MAQKDDEADIKSKTTIEIEALGAALERLGTTGYPDSSVAEEQTALTLQVDAAEGSSASVDAVQENGDGDGGGDGSDTDTDDTSTEAILNATSVDNVVDKTEEDPSHGGASDLAPVAAMAATAAPGASPEAAGIDGAGAASNAGPELAEGAGDEEPGSSDRSTIDSAQAPAHDDETADPPTSTGEDAVDEAEGDVGRADSSEAAATGFRDGASLADLLEDGDEHAALPAPTSVPGEFRVRLCLLKRWDLHERKKVTFDKGPARALLHSAAYPDTLEPLGVLAIGNVWVVGDGAARLDALIEQHGADSTIEVRVVQLDGDEAAIVMQRFRQTFCTIEITEFEKARLLAALCSTSGVHYKTVAGTIDWTPSKVTKYLTGAYLERLYPRFFELLHDPLRPSIDYAYHAGKAIKPAEKKEGALAPLLAALEKLLRNKKRYEGDDALAKLGIAKTANPRAKAKGEDPATRPTAASLKAVESIEILDEQDNPAGAFEVLADHVPRLRLPVGVGDMRADEKAYLKARYIEQIERYFA